MYRYYVNTASNSIQDQLMTAKQETHAGKGKLMISV